MNEVLTAAGLAPQTITATTAGSAVDMANCTAATGAILDVGAISGTTPSLTVQIEESDDGLTNWTAIPGMAFSPVTAANKHQVVRGLRIKRYARANAATVFGTSPSFAACVQLVAQKRQVQAVGAPAGGFDRYPSA